MSDLGQLRLPLSDDVSAAELERMVAALQQTGQYEVLRRFEPPARYADPDDSETRTALAVDVETTGLDSTRDRIIQFSAVPFSYAPDTARIYTVGQPATYYEDPGFDIRPEITALTGISNDTVAGQRIDDNDVNRLAESADLVIAHNARFDRGFVEPRLPIFETKAWACSWSEVPWPMGAQSTRLEFLLYKHCGLFFAAHTADADCLALIHLLATPFESGELPMAHLLAASRRSTLRIWATGAPYDRKDQLKARQYHWNSGDDGRPKAWYRDLAEDEGPAELDWLREQVYGGREGQWRTETFGADRRFSARA